MKITNPIGKKGEDIAVKFLKNKDYKIIETNFRKHYGEIDIIAIDEKTLVFIEVKTRSSDKFGDPFESITSWKLKAVIKTANLYKASHKNLPDSLRIDAIAVKLNTDQEVENIKHIENISV